MEFCGLSIHGRMLHADRPRRIAPAKKEGFLRKTMCVGASFALIGVLLMVASATSLSIENASFSMEPLGEDGVASGKGFRIAISEGAAVRARLEFTNKTETPLPLKVYGADVDKAPDGGVDVNSFDPDPSGVGSWIRPEASDLVLPPGVTSTLTFAIARPRGASEGTGAIVAESVERTSERVEFVDRLALLVEVVDGGPAPEVSLGAHLEVPKQVLPNLGSVIVTLENLTADQIASEVTGEVRGLLGGTYPLRPRFVRVDPGGTATVELEWDSGPAWGGYLKAEVSIDHAGGAIASSDRVFVVPLWTLIALGLSVAVVLWSRLLRRLDTPRPALVRPETAEDRKAIHKALSALHEVDAILRRALEEVSMREAAMVVSALEEASSSKQECSAPVAGLIEKSVAAFAESYSLIGAAIGGGRAGDLDRARAHLTRSFGAIDNLERAEKDT
jgi:hypothetical protein